MDTIIKKPFVMRCSLNKKELPDTQILVYVNFGKKKGERFFTGEIRYKTKRMGIFLIPNWMIKRWFGIIKSQKVFIPKRGGQ